MSSDVDKLIRFIYGRLQNIRSSDLKLPVSLKNLIEEYSKCFAKGIDVDQAKKAMDKLIVECVKTSDCEKTSALERIQEKTSAISTQNSNN